jgi:toxin ParE1/3/4
MVQWTVLAIQDMKHMHAHIAKDAPRAAGNVLRIIYNTVCTQIVALPFSAREGRVRGTRELVVPRLPYIVVYRVVGDTVTVLRVLHGAMRWPDSFGEV